jgi:hypothetical protein
MTDGDGRERREGAMIITLYRCNFHEHCDSDSHDNAMKVVINDLINI